MIVRCTLCNRILWFWQRHGWTVGIDGRRYQFHAGCWAAR